MGASTVGGLPFPPGTGVPPQVDQDIEDLTVALDPQIVPKFADVTARNAAYSGVSTTLREGSRCWIKDRNGYSFFDGTQWLWEPQRNVICKVNTGALDIFNTVGDTSGNGNVVASTLNVTLPPGQRLLEVQVGVQATAITSGTSWRARAYVDGASLVTSIIGQTKFDALNQEDYFSRTFFVARSNNAVYNLHGINVDSAGWIRFQNVDIMVIDLGPYDGVTTF